MAQRRMFSLDIVDTDLFLDMPASTQNLYFHLGMRADDDGFVASPRRITSLVSCSNDDLKLLISKGFIIPFESSICVVRDWKINNYIQKDRYRETIYLAEKSTLDITKTGSYSIMDTKRIQPVSMMDTQDRLGKVSIELGEGSIGEVDCSNATSVSQGVCNPNSLSKLQARFEEFWGSYPRKVGKAAALKKWMVIKPSEELLSRILEALNEQKKSSQWKRDNGQYIPHPTTWLNQGRWDDEPTGGRSDRYSPDTSKEKPRVSYTREV